MKLYEEEFRKPIEDIHEDIFCRPDCFEYEKWYEHFQHFLHIGVCSPEQQSIPDVRKALKIMGFETRIKVGNGKIYIVPKKGGK